MVLFYKANLISYFSSVTIKEGQESTIACGSDSSYSFPSELPPVDSMYYNSVFKACRQFAGDCIL